MDMFATILSLYITESTNNMKHFSEANELLTLVQLCMYTDYSTIYRQVTRGKVKSGAVVKHQRKVVVLITTSNVKGHFKSSFFPDLVSVITSIYNHIHT